MTDAQLTSEEARLAPEDRWLTFEVAGSTYALPIADVLEVTEVGRIGAVPNVPLDIGGVMNHHGDALPVVSKKALFRTELAVDSASQHVLVIADSTGMSAYLGLPVDGVLGLVAGGSVRINGPDLIAERRPIDGRIVSLVDAGRLRALAADAISHSTNDVDREEPEIGGET